MTATFSHSNERRLPYGFPYTRAARWAPVIVLASGYVLSRLAVQRSGIGIDTYPLANYWQYIDPVLLRDRLLESLYYLHSQPPLYNLFLGVVLKLFPQDPRVAFALIYKLLGLCLTLTLYALVRGMGVGRWLCVGLTLLFVLSPVCIHFENLLSYEYPAVVLLCGAALALQRFGDSGRSAMALLAFGSMAGLVLIRGLFQWPWLVLVLVLVARLAPPSRRRSACYAALAPLAVVLVLQVKNFVVFDTLTTSSWFGMNLLRVVTAPLPDADYPQWISSGVISPMAAVGTFRPLEIYRPYLGEIPVTGVPLLDAERTSTDGPSYHHVAYVAVGRQFGADAVRLIARQPLLYAHGVARAACIFFWPATDARTGTARALAKRMPLVQWFYSRLVYGQLWGPAPVLKELERSARTVGALAGGIGWSLLVGAPLLIAYGCIRLRAELRAGRRDGGVLALAFIVVTTVYLTAVSIACEIGENNRFRFLIEPFLVALLGVWLQHACVPRLRRWLGRGALDQL